MDRLHASMLACCRSVKPAHPQSTACTPPSSHIAVRLPMPQSTRLCSSPLPAVDRLYATVKLQQADDAGGGGGGGGGEGLLSQLNAIDRADLQRWVLALLRRFRDGVGCCFELAAVPPSSGEHRLPFAIWVFAISQCHQVRGSAAGGVGCTLPHPTPCVGQPLPRSAPRHPLLPPACRLGPSGTWNSAARRCRQSRRRWWRSGAGRRGCCRTACRSCWCCRCGVDRRHAEFADSCAMCLHAGAAGGGC